MPDVNTNNGNYDDDLSLNGVEGFSSGPTSPLNSAKSEGNIAFLRIQAPAQVELELDFVEKFWNNHKKDFIDKIMPQFFAETLLNHKVFNDDDFKQYNQWYSESGNIDDPKHRIRIYKDLNERIWDKLSEKIQKDPEKLTEIIDCLRVDDWYNKLADNWQLHVDAERKKQQQQQQYNDQRHSIGILDEKLWHEKSKLKMINFPEPIAKHIDRRQKRKEIINYLEKFHENGKGWLVLYGIHGSGKTVLAESSVRKLKSELFKHGIFWIQIGDLSNGEMFDQSLYLKMEILYDSIKFLHKELLESKSEKLKTIKEDLKRYFLLHNKSLIILDDVRSENTLKHFNFGVPVLVTTIDRSVASILDNIEYNFVSITNDGTDTILNNDESIDLLIKYFPKPLDRNYLDQSRYLPDILKKVNGVPYYIPLIANYMIPLVNDNNFGIFNQERCNKLDSTIWKELSEMVHDNLCHKLLEQTIDEIKKKEPELVEYLYDFSIFFDPIPSSVLNVLWSKKLHNYPRINMKKILQQLINKSLLKVHSGLGIPKSLIENKLYSIHDLTADFLSKQLGPEKQKERHSILIDSFELYLKNDANVENEQYDEEREQIKNYIHHCLSLHIYSSERYDLFPKYFLDLNFLKEKIRYVGQSHILVEFENFRNCFNGWQSKMIDMQRFIASSADISEPSQIDLFQLALRQPNDSFVYREAIEKLTENHGFYFEWCNKDNYALENQLIKLRFKCKDNTKYAALSPNSNFIATINDCELNLYDGKTGNLVNSQKRHNKTINHCTFSSNGQYLLTTADDGKAILWHSPLTIASNQSTEFLDQRKRASSYNSALQSCKEFIAPSNKLKADSSTIETSIKYKCGDISSNNTYVLLGTTTGFIYLYSIEKSNMIAALPNPDHLEYEVETCCFSHNNSYFIFTISESVYVYKLDADENNNDTVKMTLLYKLKHTGKVYNAVFYPGRRSKRHPIGIFSSSGKNICEWNLYQHSFSAITKLFKATPKEITKPNTEYVLPQDVQGLISYCAVSPKGDRIAGFECTRFEIYIWDIKTKSYKKGAISYWIPLHTSFNIHTMSFSCDGERLLSLNSKNEITFWDIKEFDSVKSVVDLKDDFAAAINKYDSKLNVLTIDNKGFLRLFKDKSGIEDQKFKTNLKQKLKDYCPETIQPKLSIICCDISPYGYSIFCTDFGDVFFYKHDDFQLIYTKQPDSEKILKCKFIPNQNNDDDLNRIRFVTMSEKELNFYEFDSGINSIINLKTEKENKTNKILESFYFISSKIIIYWYRDNSCNIFDCQQMKTIRSIQKTNATITSIHSCKVDNNYFIAISLADERLSVLCLNSQELELVGWKTLNREIPRCCQICKQFVVYGCDSGKICLAQSERFEETSTNISPNWTRQHSIGSFVNHLAISIDQKYIVSAADSIKIWKSYDGTLLQTFISHGDISRMFVNFSSPSNNSIVIQNNGHQHHQNGQNGIQPQLSNDHDQEKEYIDYEEEEEEEEEEDEDEEADQTDGQSASTMNDINITIVAITNAKSLYILENYRH